MLKSKSEDSIKKYNLVASENIRLKQDVNDLSRQVTVLLHEIEKLRTKLVNSHNKSLNMSSRNMDHEKSMDSSFNLSQTIHDDQAGEVSSSTEATSKNLFLFRYYRKFGKFLFHTEKTFMLG